MFEIGWSEMLVIAIVLIVVVGPKDLPKMLRGFGQTTAKLRAMAGDFRKQFDEALKEAELDEVKDIVKDARKLDPTAEIRKAFNPMESAARDVRAGLDAAFKPTGSSPQATKPAAQPSPLPEPPPAEPVPAAPLKPGASAAAGEAPAGSAPKARAKAKPAVSPTARTAAAAKSGAATPRAKAAKQPAKAAKIAAPAKRSPSAPAATKSTSKGKTK